MQAAYWPAPQHSGLVSTVGCSARMKEGPRMWVLSNQRAGGWRGSAVKEDRKEGRKHGAGAGAESWSTHGPEVAWRRSQGGRKGPGERQGAWQRRTFQGSVDSRKGPGTGGYGVGSGCRWPVFNGHAGFSLSLSLSALSTVVKFIRVAPPSFPVGLTNPKQYADWLPRPHFISFQPCTIPSLSSM